MGDLGKCPFSIQALNGLCVNAKSEWSLGIKITHESCGCERNSSTVRCVKKKKVGGVACGKL